MSFMRQIEATQRSPLDQLAVDFHVEKMVRPTIDFCCRTYGVPDDDEKIARRLSVAVATVRGWREVGRRASTRSSL